MSTLQEKRTEASSYRQTLLKLEKIKFSARQNEAKKLLKIRGIDNLRQLLTISIFYRGVENALYSLNYGQKVNIIKAVNQTKDLVGKFNYSYMFERKYLIDMYSFFSLFGKNFTKITSIRLVRSGRRYESLGKSSTHS